MPNNTQAVLADLEALAGVVGKRIADLMRLENAMAWPQRLSDERPQVQSILTDLEAVLNALNDNDAKDLSSLQELASAFLEKRSAIVEIKKQLVDVRISSVHRKQTEQLINEAGITISLIRQLKDGLDGILPEVENTEVMDG